MHGAGADLAAALQRARDMLQERVAALDGNWPGGSHDGGEFGIGKACDLMDRNKS
jgi:hypothetical protein